MNSVPALQLDEASKFFPGPDGGRSWALRPTSLVVNAGSSVALVGRSGSGKTTLLHIAAGIEAASAGSVQVHGHELAALTDGERTLFRRRHIGLVFQFFHLIPHLSVRENVLLPAMIAGDLKQSEERADELLARVELGDRSKGAVDHLSGGEMQRVAICRALLRRPTLLLADEPTGNLDDATGRVVMDLLLDMVREEGLTLVLVTHSEEVAGRAERIVKLTSGAAA